MAQKWNPLGVSAPMLERKCPSCRASLGKWRAREKYLKADGSEISLDILKSGPVGMFSATFQIYADKFSDKSLIVECPDCRHRWPYFKDGTMPETPAKEDFSIEELYRSEEVIGVETRTIDNSRSQTAVTRKFNVSRDWTQEISIEKTETSSVHAGLKVGVDISGLDLAEVTAGAEATVMQRYTSASARRHTYSEEVSVEVAAFAKTRVEFTWKRFWQHGKVVSRSNGDVKFQVPFSVVVGISFDQAQIDERSTYDK